MWLSLNFLSEVLFAVSNGASSKNRAETYSFETGKWTAVLDYPFSSYVSYAPIIHIRNSFYVIGGNTAVDSQSKTIARFSMVTQRWSQAGSLNNGRHGHGAIEQGNSFLVVGGWGTYPTEKCTVKANGEVQCENLRPDLFNYRYYPELFFVSYDFC